MKDKLIHLSPSPVAVFIGSLCTHSLVLDIKFVDVLAASQILSSQLPDDFLAAGSNGTKRLTTNEALGQPSISKNNKYVRNM